MPQEKKRRKSRINPIRAAKLKQELLKGKSQRQALIDAGFAVSTANKRIGNLTTLKVVTNSIINDFRASNLTPDKVIQGLEEIRKLCLTGRKKDYSTAVRIHELYGKYLRMWSENTTTNTAIFTSLLPQEQDIITRRLKPDTSETPTIPSNEPKQTETPEIDPIFEKTPKNKVNEINKIMPMRPATNTEE